MPRPLKCRIDFAVCLLQNGKLGQDQNLACADISARKCCGGLSGLFTLALRRECEGVERRKARPRCCPLLPFGLCGCAHCVWALAFRRSTCGDFSPRGRASGRRQGHNGAPVWQAFARLRPHRVQPLKAEPRSGPGRLPEASRVRGYEPRPQAPHPAPSFRTSPEDAPHRAGRQEDKSRNRIESSPYGKKYRT